MRKRLNPDRGNRPKPPMQTLAWVLVGVLILAVCGVLAGCNSRNADGAGQAGVPGASAGREGAADPGGGTSPGVSADPGAGTVPGASASPGGSGISITVVSPFHEGDGNRANFVKAYQAFEASSGCRVLDESAVSNEGWKAEVMAAFEAGREPDVLFYFTGADADMLIQEGKVIPLSVIRGEYPDYAANMKDALLPVSPKDGRQYAVPVSGYWEGLFVNKKVLADCGVALPDENYSWEQFLLDCESIKAKGYTPVACSLAEVPHYWFEFCVLNQGGLGAHLSRPGGAGDAAGQRWAAGLRDIKELYDKGFFPDDTLTAPDSETSQLMLDDKAAFMLDGSWKVGWFQERAARAEDFAVVYVPARDARKPTDFIGGFSMGYYITRKAWDDPDRRAACAAFVEAMTGDQVVASFGALSFTALKTPPPPPDGTDPLAISALTMTAGCTGTVPAVQDTVSPDARQALFADLPAVASGALSPEAAIDNCAAIESPDASVQ